MMEIPQIGTPLGTLIVTCCLWLWTIKDNQTHLLHHAITINNQNVAVGWSFGICVLVGLLCVFSVAPLWLVSLLCLGALGSFLLLSSRGPGGLWCKKVNIVAAGAVGPAVFGLLSMAFENPCFVPLLSAIIIAHLAQRRFLTIVAHNLSDLEALKAKILKLEADDSNHKTLKPSLPSPPYVDAMETTA